MGTKRSVLVDEKGLPLAVVLSGANTHDVKLLEETLDHIVVLHPESDEEHPQNLCLDAGYTGSAEKVQKHGYTPHIRPRGEEKKELERNPEFRARRWVVEVTHSFFNRFRKLLVRFEKKAANYSYATFSRKKQYAVVGFCRFLFQGGNSQEPIRRNPA